MALQKFIIERDIPEVGTFEREQLRGATVRSAGMVPMINTVPVMLTIRPGFGL